MKNPPPARRSSRNAAVGREWPRITIVTPSFNQAAFLEETLQSVLGQGYPNLEYFVIDGGSADGSVDIIRRHAPRLAGWLSEPDNGQAHAINKGLARATGEIFGFLNSDDLLVEGALFAIAEAFNEADLVAGVVENFGMGPPQRVRNRGFSFTGLLLLDRRIVLHQPGIWMRTEALRRAGPFREDLHYLFDYDVLLHLLRARPRIVYLDRLLARFRRHPYSKTQRRARYFRRDHRVIHRAHLSDPSLPAALRRRGLRKFAREDRIGVLLRYRDRCTRGRWPGWRQSLVILGLWLRDGLWSGFRRSLFYLARLGCRRIGERVREIFRRSASGGFESERHRP